MSSRSPRIENYTSQFPFNPLSLRISGHAGNTGKGFSSVFWRISSVTRMRLTLLPKSRICRFGLVSVLQVQLCRVRRPAAPRTRRCSVSCSEGPLEEDTMRARRGCRCVETPSSSGRGRISVGLRALVNIIGSWCVKLTVPVRTPRATSPIKPSRAALLCCKYTQEGDV